MASPAYPPLDGAIRLCVIADSTAFTGPEGPLLPDEPALYPNVAARAIEDALGKRVAVSTLAHPGAGVRDSWYRVTKDRHVMFEVLMRSDAVVIGIGSFDHAPAGVPPVIESLIPYIPLTRMRSAARAVMRAAHPWGVHLTGGRFTRIAAHEYERLYDGVLYQVRSLTWGAPTVALGPTSHRSPYYGHVHPQHAARSALQRRVCDSHNISVVETWPLVEPHIEKLNSDGIHWPLEAHESIGSAIASSLIDQFEGRVRRPGIPGFPEYSA
ncbi:MAG: hypothetical protein ACYDCC_07080 [Actinomycetota bacterium]